MHKGRCECGAVAYEADSISETASFCHCTQCRRTSGHYWSAVMAPLDGFRLTEDSGLAWYASSDWAKRGFCTRCGSSLFYQLQSEDAINIATGTLDDSAGVKPGKHIFCKDKGTYYDLPNDAPHIETY